MEYYSAMKNNEILPFATTWMDLEGIILSEISHTKTNTVCYHLHVKSKRYNKGMNITKQKQICQYREQTSGYELGEGRGDGQERCRRLRGTKSYV